MNNFIRVYRWTVRPPWGDTEMHTWDYGWLHVSKCWHAFDWNAEVTVEPPLL